MRDDVPAARAALKAGSRDFQTEKKHALDLFDLGEFDLSVAILRDLAQNVPRDTDRIRLLGQIGKVLYEAGQTEQAQLAIREARRLLHRLACTADDRPVLNAELEFTNAKAIAQMGKLRESLQLTEHARDFVAPCILANELSQLFDAELLGWIRGCQMFFGLLHESIATYEHAIAIVENAKSPTPLLADLLWQQGRCYSQLPGGMTAAREKNAEALDLATRASRLHVLARAHSSESLFQYWDGRMKSAIDHGRLAVAITNRMSGPEESALVSLSFARIEAATGVNAPLCAVSGKRGSACPHSSGALRISSKARCCSV
ncbi:MAG: hypothetical protein GIX03_02420 [Candidatus Eremiobacteraeota bacterium]|nr:hypothetical protein [Candidatus Eremiobacteraeota bacterium]MBC5805700.1 hypothetical protein [Candidatus Eremiobacteraeota bacterium]MBC5825310.1 hypothetical protein [Candidatus Eremiobacteraeota bacterium]